MLKQIVLVVFILNITACSGIRTTDDSFTTHAEGLNILFLTIPPSDRKKRALEMVPEGGKIVSMTTSPYDLTSFIGVINRIIGINYARVEGTLANK